ncbi:MAG: DUF2278 family protein, partial [Armatimonadetes bacterium]|nr:DUF2278 family protein [Armatimonadota bacterium]
LGAAGAKYRVAVNVKSTDRDRPELLFLVNGDFRHEVTRDLPVLPEGFLPLERKPGGPALDYIRGNLLDRREMKALPHDLPGADNDLNERVDFYLRQARDDPEAYVYAFGSRWGPEPRRKDKVFGFRPGNGIHDVHMNQGNPRGRHDHDNGVYQDGALMIHFASQNRWTAIFLAFQSQAWHTDDRTGHPAISAGDKIAFGPAYAPDPSEPDSTVRIVAAMVNPRGGDATGEAATLLNTTPDPILLDGWRLADRVKNTMPLAGVLLPNAPLVVPLTPEISLGNKGGILTLLDPQGMKVDGVSYTREDAAEAGRTLVF